MAYKELEMKKETYEKFGLAIDELESVVRDTTDVIQKAYIEACVKQLDRIYNEIKEEVK